MLIPVSQVINRHRGTELIGDTLFVDGTPHKVCLRCGTIVKQFDGVSHVAVHNGRKTKELKPYKVVFVMFKHEPDYILDSDGAAVAVADKMKVIIKSGPACFDCWESFQRLKDSVEFSNKLNGTNKIAAFPWGEMQGGTLKGVKV